VAPAGDGCQWRWEPDLGEFICVFDPIGNEPPGDGGEPPCDPWRDANWCECDEEANRAPVLSAAGTRTAESSRCPGWEDPGDGPGDGGGDGGGGSGEEGSDAPHCNPRTEPDCEQPLTQKDLETIEIAFRTYLRTSFTDPMAQLECQEMAATFLGLLEQGRVIRGRTDTDAADPDAHVGLYDPDTGHMHFEPAYLDTANLREPMALKDLLNTALHEGAHALNKRHGEAINSMWGPLYSDLYFHRLSPGANSCINY
jgi:hypothetical protein